MNLLVNFLEKRVQISLPFHLLKLLSSLED